MSPQVRFLLVLTILAIVAWAGRLVFGYALSDNGLDVARYIHGATYMLGAMGVGYVIILVILKYYQYREGRLTGFEAKKIDETGTEFNMQLSLSKFIPDIQNEPKGMMALESQLIGFLNNLGDLPMNLDTPTLTLKDYSLNIWEHVKTFEGADAYHRVGALAANLGKVYAYEEKTSKLKGGKPTYKLRAIEHGGMAAFILSQMPAFRNLHADPKENLALRRGLLTGVRYIQNAGQIPTNSPPLAKEICSFYNRAVAQIQGKTAAAGSQTITELDVQNLQTAVEGILPTVLEDLLTAATTQPTEPPTLLALNRAHVAVTPAHLVHGLLAGLDAELRSIFNLWESATAEPVLLTHLLPHLAQKGWLLETYGGSPIQNGLLALSYQNQALPPMVLLSLTDPLFNSAVTHIKPLLSHHAALVEPTFNLAQHTQTLQQDAQKITAQLRGLFPVS